MNALAYEKWFGSPGAETTVALRALHAARLDSLIADSHDDGVIVLDDCGRIVEVNAVLERRCGADREALLGTGLSDLVVPEHRRRVEAAVLDTLTGDGVRVRARGLDRGGRTCELAITFVPLFADDRAIVGALVLARDLSAANVAAVERQRDERLLELAGRVAGFTGWSLDIASGALDWSGGIAALDDGLPASLDDLRGMLTPVDAARLARAIERATRENRMLDITIAVDRSSGSRHLRLVGETARVAGSPGTVLRGAAHDVTDAVIEQRQRREVEQLLATTLNSMTDGLGVLDGDWRFTFVNDRLADMLGVDSDVLLGAELWHVAPELGGTELEIGFRSAVEQGETVHVRDRIEPLDIWLEAIAYPSAGGLAVLLRDVSEAERAAVRYREAQNELTTLGRLLDVSREAIVLCELDETMRYANDGALELYGWRGIAIDGVAMGELVGVDEAAMLTAADAVRATGLWSGRLRVRTLDGRDLVLSTRLQLMHDASGEPESVLSVSTDVTDEVAREEAVRRVERMESLGTFAGGIAHDLNNVLTPILMASQLLGRSLESTPDHETAAMIEAAARRGADMVRQVLAFARGLESRADRVDLTAVLDELRMLVASTVPPDIALRIEPPAERIVLSGDATQLLQVLANLIRNAADAIRGSGSITVDARLELGAEGEPVVVLSVADTGHGMSPEIIARLWEPFFTTKDAGKGTGLGLAMVASIVRAHGGRIIAESDGATGSRFTIRLPVVEVDRSDVVRSEPPPDESRGAGQLVLVVDDEPAIRAVLRQVLREHGYEVVVASSGDDALELVRSGRQRPAMVLSDVMMPRGSGIQLAERLASTGIPVVLMSGRQDPAAVPGTAAPSVAAFLEKPLTTSALLAAVREALDASAARGGAQ